GIPIESAAILRDQGYVCSHVSEKNMSRAADEEILQLAARESCVLITLDSDFHSIIAVQGLAAPSVLRIRKEGCKAEQVANLVLPVLLQYSSRLRAGCLISVKERKVTFKALPITATPKEGI
ncbi:MAG: DUF5615 family PIN-like protein, partial [Bryobacterales bacterium]|nr:DUF5615 family PIN-like protein [Bryobacterales bacterium]